MALIVEDGTNIPNANSYVSVADIRAFSTARLIALPAEDSKVEAFAILAMDFLELQSFKGEKTYTDQSLQFPRTEVYINNVLQASDVVPTNIKTCQVELAIQQSLGYELFPTKTRDDYLTSKSIEGAISKTWDKNAPAATKFPKVEKLLTPFLFSSFGSGSFSVYRG